MFFTKSVATSVLVALAAATSLVLADDYQGSGVNLQVFKNDINEFPPPSPDNPDDYKDLSKHKYYSPGKKITIKPVIDLDYPRHVDPDTTFWINFQEVHGDGKVDITAKSKDYERVNLSSLKGDVRVKVFNNAKGSSDVEYYNGLLNEGGEDCIPTVV